MNEQQQYSDNVLVRQNPRSAEFLAVRFNIEEALLRLPSHGHAPISLNRYEVPGRTDVYTFDWVPGGCGTGDRVRYFSDHGLPLAAAAAMAARDLNKKAAVEMLLEACRTVPHMRDAIHALVEKLLPALAPKSAALRDCAEYLRKMREERHKLVRGKR